MSKFSALEMSKEVAKHPMISKSHGIFGHFQHAIYKPTDSQVESYSNYYSKSDAEQIRDFINSSDQVLDEEIAAFPQMSSDTNSAFRLDLCISHDCQFLAMQLNHVSETGIIHITPIRFFEGAQAQKVEDLF